MITGNCVAPLGAGRAARTHRVRVAILAVLLVAGLVVGPASPAAAHNALLESRPGDGEKLERGPDDVLLRFNQEAQDGYGTVVVTGPEGGQWQDGELRVSGATVTQPLRPLGPAGTYDVAWRVISADGHPVSGTFGFTVRREGNGTPVPESAAETGADGRGWWWLTGGLVVGALLLAGVVLIVVTGLSRRGRTRRSAS